jgi:hypothetical protein
MTFVPYFGRLDITPQSQCSILCLAEDSVSLYTSLKNNVMRHYTWSRHFPLPQSPLGDYFLRERSIGYPSHSTTCQVCPNAVLGRFNDERDRQKLESADPSDAIASQRTSVRSSKNHETVHNKQTGAHKGDNHPNSIKTNH